MYLPQNNMKVRAKVLDFAVEQSISIGKLRIVEDDDLIEFRKRPEKEEEQNMDEMQSCSDVTSNLSATTS